MTPLRVTVLVQTNASGLWILPQVRELRRRGHEVTVVLPPGPGRLTSVLTDEGFPVLCSPFDFRFRPGTGTLRGLWRLRQLIRRLRPDVVNYHLYAAALAARFSTLGMPLRKVHVVAGSRYLESPLVRSVERFLWRMDHVTICCTDHLSRLYRKLGAPIDRLPVAQYGIDVGYFSPAPVPSGAAPDARLDDGDGRAERRAKARAEIGMDDEQFLVTMVGYVHPPKRMVHNGREIKGDDVLRDAWRQFHARHPRSHLLLIGEGFTAAGAAYRRRLAHRFGLDDASVTWLGWVPDLRTYLAAADLGVIPSRSSDDAVREASASALPTIVGDAGGLPETVDYRCGWVVPRGDPAALGSALDAAYREFEAGSLAARGEHARRRALRLFGDRAAAARVVDIIEVLARGGRGPAVARAVQRGDR